MVSIRLELFTETLLFVKSYLVDNYEFHICWRRTRLFRNS